MFRKLNRELEETFLLTTERVKGDERETLLDVNFRITDGLKGKFPKVFNEAEWEKMKTKLENFLEALRLVRKYRDSYGWSVAVKVHYPRYYGVKVSIFQTKPRVEFHLDSLKETEDLVNRLENNLDELIALTEERLQKVNSHVDWLNEEIYEPDQLLNAEVKKRKERALSERAPRVKLLSQGQQAPH